MKENKDQNSSDQYDLKAFLTPLNLSEKIPEKALKAMRDALRKKEQVAFQKYRKMGF